MCVVKSSPALDKDVKEEHKNDVSAGGSAVADRRTAEVKTDVTADGMRIETNWDQVVTSFDEMGLKDELLRGMYIGSIYLIRFATTTFLFILY
jgi:hypothetical protein